MLLKNASALIGKELRYVESTNIKIVRGRFGRIGTEIHAGASETSIDCEGLLVMPGMVNAHTHIGDSIGKDIALGASVDSRVHPVHGVKSRILAETNPEHLVTFMLASCKSMIKNGITTFVDFREGGLDGVNLLRKAVSESPIRAIILGRLDLYQNRQEIRQNRAPAIGHVRDLEELLKKCDGVGISGANEHSDATLRAYSKAPKIRAIHCMETQDASKYLGKQREGLKLCARSDSGQIFWYICTRCSGLVSASILDFTPCTGCTLESTEAPSAISLPMESPMCVCAFIIPGITNKPSQSMEVSDAPACISVPMRPNLPRTILILVDST